MYRITFASFDEKQVEDVDSGTSLGEALAINGFVIAPDYCIIGNDKLDEGFANIIPEDNDDVFVFFGEAPAWGGDDDDDGGGGGSIWSYVVGGALTVIGLVTANALVTGVGLMLLASAFSSGNQSSSLSQSSDSSTGGFGVSPLQEAGQSLDSIIGADVQIKTDSKVPLPTGSYTFRPSLASQVYTEVVSSEKIKSKMLLIAGYDTDIDTILPADLKVVDNLFTEINDALFGETIDYVIPKSSNFSGNVGDEAFDIDLSSSITPGRQPADIRVLLKFTGGLYFSRGSDGAVMNTQIQFDCEYRIGGVWTPKVFVVERGINDGFFHELVFGGGLIDKIRIISADIPDRLSYATGNHINAFIINQIGWRIDKDLVNTDDVRTLGISYANTSKVDGNSLKITLDTRMYVRSVLDLNKYISPKNKGNPADILLYLATSPNSLGARALPDSRVDMDALNIFNRYCAARDYNFVLPISDGRAFMDATREIALVGNGIPSTNPSGQFSVIIDDYFDENYDSIAKPQCCAVNSSNTLSNSWVVSKANITNSLKNTVIKILFVDGATNRESISYIFLDARRYYNGSAASPKTFAEIMDSITENDIIETYDMTRYEGIIDPAHIFSMGRRDILKRWYTTKEIKFRVGERYKGWTFNDRIWLNHAVLSNWSIDGHILNIAGNTITLDRVVQDKFDEMMNDWIPRYYDAPKADIIINDIVAGTTNTYPILDIVNGNTIIIDGTISSWSEDKDQTFFSVGSGFNDSLINRIEVGDDGEVATISCIDYVYDETCRPDIADPFAMYDNADWLKYGNPYFTYLETVPNHYINETMD